MFSNLRQGNIVYILDKSDKLSLKTGQVLSVTTPQSIYPNLPNSTVNISVNVDGNKMDFNSIPNTQSIVNYNSGAIVLSDNKESMNIEVENMINNSKTILENIDYHKNIVSQGEEVLKILNPQFAKDKARDEEISNLKDKVSGVESKLDTIITLLGKEKTE